MGPGMRRARFLLTGLAAAVLLPGAALAQAAQLAESQPAAGAELAPGAHRFLVRFDRPIDHYRSRLVIVRDGQVLLTLQPRLESAPEVLFAMSPVMAPGAYEFRWSVISMQGGMVTEGSAPFTVRQ